MAANTSSKLASSLFSAGAVEKLITVDPYKVNNSGVKTNVSILDTAKGISDSALKVLRNTPGTVRDLARVVTVTNGKIGVDGVGLLNRIVSLGSGTSGPFAALNSAVQSKVIDGLAALGVNPDTSLQIKAVVGDAVGVIARSNITDVRGLMDIMSTITGNKNVATLLDSEAELALYGSLINEAIRLGVPDALDILSDKVKSDSTKRRIVEMTLLQAITYNDRDTVRKIVQRIGPAAAKAQVPEIVTLLLTFYTFPEGNVQDSYPALLTELVSLVALLDPTWATYTRNGVDITDLAPFTYASDDALTLFKTDEQYRLAVLVAPSYPKQNLVAIAQNSFEYLVLTDTRR